MQIPGQEIQRIFKNSRCLYSQIEVDSAISTMAAEINSALAGLDPLVLCVMNGGLVLTGKLITQQLEYLHATRYRDTIHGASLEWRTYPASDLHGRNILIVDDILDEGETLTQIIRYCEEQGVNKVYTAVLIDKQHDRKVAQCLKADFTGLYAKAAYLYGNGMDYKGYLRNAAGIYAVAQKDLV